MKIYTVGLVAAAAYAGLLMADGVWRFIPNAMLGYVLCAGLVPVALMFVGGVLANARR